MNLKTHYCPICGMDRQMAKNTTCDWCGNKIEMVESIHPHQYYREEAQRRYNKKYIFNVTEEEAHSILLEEARNNPLFDEELSKRYFEQWRNEVHAANATNPYFNQVIKNNKTPKCPTCDSTNISKISTASKVMGGAMFGLFSKTARSQFKCNNCGYKW